MFKKALLAIYLLCTTSCNLSKKIDKGLTPKEIEIFFKCALDAEFGDNDYGLKKWNKDILVFIKNPEQEQLLKEFKKIRTEINELSSGIKIIQVDVESKANFIIFFSDKYNYAAYEPSTMNYLDENFGMFWVHWNRELEIEKGSMYVDVKRTKEIDCQKHLLREELTQALGLMNDHSYDKESIFYSGWNCTTTYSLLDKKIIGLFLDEKLEAGMNSSQIKKVIGK